MMTRRPTKLLILIEDLSNLLYSTNEPRDVLEFLRKLRFLRRDVEISVGTLVTSSETFSNLVAQVLPSLAFSVKPLKTGFSTQVNGVLGVRKEEKVFRKESITTSWRIGVSGLFHSKQNRFYKQKLSRSRTATAPFNQKLVSGFYVLLNIDQPTQIGHAVQCYCELTVLNLYK